MQVGNKYLMKADKINPRHANSCNKCGLLMPSIFLSITFHWTVKDMTSWPKLMRLTDYDCEFKSNFIFSTSKFTLGLVPHFHHRNKNIILFPQSKTLTIFILLLSHVLDSSIIHIESSQWSKSINKKRRNI